MDPLTAIALSAVALSCFVAGRLTKRGGAPGLPRALPGQRYRLEDGREVRIANTVGHWVATGAGMHEYVGGVMLPNHLAARLWLRNRHA